MHKGLVGFAKYSILILTFVALAFVAIINTGVVSATHDAIVTIDPGVTNCEEVPGTFTVTIENDNSVVGADNIFEVRIYESATGIVDDSFACGGAPSGWTLSDYAGGSALPDYGYCEYKTYVGGDDDIKPGESEDFTFDAQMEIAQNCLSSFTISTLDDAEPEGEHEYNDVEVYIDCIPPETDKYFQPEGTYKIDGDVEWIDCITEVVLDAADDTGCYDSGIKETKYVNILAEDFVEQYELECDPERPCSELSYCQSLLQYANSIPGAWWNTYDTPFKKQGGSCHVLFYYSEDKLGNVEDVKVNCFFVDTTPPEMDKDNGEAIPDSGEDMFKTQDNPNGDFHWLTTSMPITFTCDDTYDGNTELSPHPSEGEKLCFKVSYDYPSWDYITDIYCGSALTDDGYCCVAVDNNKQFEFYFKRESMHNLEYYCQDAVEKKTDAEIQYYKVDDTAPEINKIVGEPQEGECPPSQGYTDQEPFCYIKDHVTPVTFEAVDGEGLGCAVDDITCEWRYRVNGGEWSQVYTFSYKEGPFNSVSQPGSGQTEDWASAEIYKEYLSESIKWTFDITDQSDHYGVGLAIDSNNDGTPDFQIYFADWSDQYWHYQPYGATCWSGTDTTTLPAGVVTTGSKTGNIFTIEIPKTMLGGIGAQFGWMSQVRTNLLGVYPGWTPWCGPFVWETEMVSPGIIFPEDSRHDLEIRCWDALGNEVIDEETFQVDSIPPVTTKTYIPDAYTEPGTNYEYIDTIHDIKLEAEDAKVGVDEIRYRVSGALADKFCEQCEGWMEALRPDMGPWQTYTDPFKIEDESCHVIEYSSVDRLGNEEEIQWQCVFVDKTKPETEKIYTPEPYVDDNGWKYIDTAHTIALRALDPGPHPSGVAETQYRVSGSLADRFCEPANCENWMTTLRPDMGPWNTYVEPFGIDEESCHVIEYRSIDNVGKTEDIKWQCVFVDKTKPEIEKTYVGPQYPDPITPSTPYPHYISSETLVKIEAFDLGPHPSGIASIEYYVTLLKGNDACVEEAACQELQIEDGWTTYVDPFTIPQDSCHVIDIKATDNVGKTAYHRQCVFVDNKAPEVIKEITGPQMDAEEPVHKYITEDSTIRLECEDVDPHPVGGETLYWEMYWKYDDCDVDDNWGTPTASGTELTGMKEFTDLEDSCHKFVYYCEDALGNDGDPEIEIDIVDNQAPDPEKTVGEPKSAWDGQDSFFYPWIKDKCWAETDGIDCWKVTMMTPITMECNDPDPHPVDNEKVCFNVEVDAVDETAKYCDWYSGNPQWDDVFEGGLDWKEEDDSPYWQSPAGTFTPVADVGGSMVRTFDGNRKYEMSIPLSVLGVEEGDTIKIGTYILDGIHKAHHRIRNSMPDRDEFGWFDSSNWVEYTLTNEGFAVTVDGDLTDWSGGLLFTDENAYDETNGVVDRYITHSYDFYITVYDGVLYIGIDYTDDTTDELDNADIPKVFFDTDYDNKWCCADHIIEDFYFLEETEHNLKYYCVDALGNTNEIVDEEKFKVEGTKFEIPLYKKWNLISVPFVLLDSAPEEVFENTPGVESVWTYDPEECTDPSGWCVWSRIMPSDMDSIDPGWGYWVMEKDDEEWLTIGGSLFSPRELPPTRNLVDGWNLIGYYGTSWEIYDKSDANFVCGDATKFPDKYIYGDKAYCSLNSLIDTQEGYPRWSSLWSYIRCPGKGIIPEAFWVGINTCADQDSPLQMALSRMYAGRGYWIELDVEDQYVPATTCIWNSDFECKWTGGGILP